MPTLVKFGMALNDRERRTLALVGAGLTDEKIARVLGVSVETAKRVMHNLRTKLGASNRAQAVAIGFTKGYLVLTRPTKGGS